MDDYEKQQALCELRLAVEHPEQVCGLPGTLEFEIEIDRTDEGPALTVLLRRTAAMCRALEVLLVNSHTPEEVAKGILDTSTLEGGPGSTVTITSTYDSALRGQGEDADG